MSNYRIIKKENSYYPQYYSKYWIKWFNGWEFFKELCFGSFNPPTPDSYENISFNDLEKAKEFLLDKNKPTIEIVYENSK